MVHVFVLFCLCWCRMIGVFGDEVKSVTEGDSVTLNCEVTEIPKDDDILWKFRDKFGAKTSLIAEMSRAAGIFSTFDNVLDGRFRDRLKLDNQTGSLTIINITTEHSGHYEVHIRGAILTTKKFSISVYARLSDSVLMRNSSQCSSSSSSSVQYCSVMCSVVNASAVSLSWYKGNSLLSSISVSDLSISLSLPLEVEYQDKNNYSCVINNTTSNKTTHLDIDTLCQPCPGSPVSVPLLISAAAGSLLIVSSVVILIRIYRKHRKTDQEAEIQSEQITYTEPVFNKSKSKEEDLIVYAPITVRR